MGDNGGDRTDNPAGPSKSPWKTSADSSPSPAIGVDSESWPALSSVHKCNGSLDSKSPTRLDNAKNGGDRPAPPAPVPVEQSKSHGRGSNFKNYRKPNTNQNKTFPKQNSMPQYFGPLPQYPPTITPVYPTMVPVLPTSAYGYTYQSYPRPFPRGEVKFVSQPAQAFGTTTNGSFQPLPRADLGAHDFPHVGGRRSTNEQYRQVDIYWNNQLPVGPNNFHLQQNMGPRPFMGPPSFGPTGSPGTIYYYPAAPPSSVRAPYQPVSVSYPNGPGVPMPPSPTMTLRAEIVNQIEYYFSDENLMKRDDYLISFMDHHGWVPISIIANFNRVKRMNVDVPFILDALQASETIEVQGDKVRRRNEWSKWIPSSRSSESAPVTENAVNHNSSMELGCRLNNGNNSDKPYDESHFPVTSHGDNSVKPTILENCETRMLSNLNVKSLDDSSNNHSSTFMLDEELELETIRNGHPSTVGRFGSTPPETHGISLSKLSVSPQSNLSGSSSPVGSVPEPFQHPSHELLEENGFTQQS